jgi:hypothetical protein
MTRICSSERICLGEFLAQPDREFIGPAIIGLALFTLLVFDQEIQAVERQATVVADDAPAAVGVRQAGDDAGLAAAANRVRVAVEHAVVVRLGVFGVDLLDLRIRLEAVGLQAVLDHAPAAARKDRALQRRVGLQADDQLEILVDVAGVVRGDAGRLVGDVEHAFLDFLCQQRLEGLPDLLACARWRRRRTRASPS